MRWAPAAVDAREVLVATAIEAARAAAGLRRAQAAFTGALAHAVEVPPGPDGRPGARLLAFSPSAYRPRMTRDACRQDFLCVLGPRGSRQLGVCLGRVEDRGEPLSSAEWTLTVSRGRADGGPVARRVGDLETVHYALQGRTARLVEWKFAGAGWLFVVGALIRPADDGPGMVARAERSLATWTWV